MSAGRGLTVIFKATDMCNAACRFCSVGPAGRERCADDDLERVAAELERLVQRSQLERLTFTFHGGEPTVLGSAWIDAACERIRRLPVTVDLCMQSNLVSLPDDLVEVARRHRIAIGSSVDPLDGQRCDAAGRDAFPRWLLHYERLVEAGFRVGAIFVVTRASLGRARELYRIAESIGALAAEPFGLQINPVYPQGRAEGSRDVLIEPTELGRFLVELWELWEASGRSVRLGPIARLAEHFWPRPGCAPQPLPCSLGGDCSATHVGIDHRLRVSGCGRRLDSEATLGSLAERHLDEILAGAEEKRAIAGRATALAAGECAGCDFFAICGGGCPDDADLVYGDVRRRTPWCEGMRVLFGAMQARARSAASPVHRAPPRTRRRAPAPWIVATNDPAAQRPPDDGPAELWLMPQPQASMLRFDADLERILAPGWNRVRLFVHARHVRALMMWRDVVRDPRVEVVLFEAEGLASAANVLNALGATIALDVPAITALPGGVAALSDLLQRFVADPLWRARVHPFAGILARSLEDELAEPRNRWGLRPGGYRVVAGAQDGAAAAGAIVRALTDDAEQSAGAWLAERRGCMSCDAFRRCGAQLAVGPEGCAPEIRSLVDRLQGVAADVHAALARADEAQV